MQEVVGSNPTEGKICVSHFTLLEWNVKNCFVKLIETLKINRKNYFVWNDDILLKNFYIDRFLKPIANVLVYVKYGNYRQYNVKYNLMI